MLALIRNRGRVLEPSAGTERFPAASPAALPSNLIPGMRRRGQSLWISSIILKVSASKTIIGSPPYVRFQDIRPETRRRLSSHHFDGRSNLYLFFYRKGPAPP